MNFVTTVFALSLVLACMEGVHSHSYLTKPKPRVLNYRADRSNSIGCPSGPKTTPTSYTAGQIIDVSYYRNNHNGGFIRWAISPTGVESKADFDKNVFYYTCRESGPTCVRHGSSNNTEVGPDGISGDNVISCGDKIQLPDYLPAGEYVLQWMWFSVGGAGGHKALTEQQFKSCADIKLTTTGSKSKPTCPAFVGGDRATKLTKKGNDVCLYFNTNEINTTNELFGGDDNKYMDYFKYGVPADYEKCMRGAAGADASANAGTSAPGAGGGGNTPAPATTTPRPVTSQPTPSKSANGGSAASDAKSKCKRR